MRLGAVQDRETEVDKPTPTRSGGSQADPERIWEPSWVARGLQNLTFPVKIRQKAEKVGSGRGSRKSIKNP